MKSAFFVEHQGNRIASKDIEYKFKEIWKEQGKRIKDLANVIFYVKPEEKACYYVVEGTDETGNFLL